MNKEKRGKEVVDRLKELGTDVYKDISKDKQPEMEMPLRDLSNVKYDDKEGFFDIIGKKKSRTLTASTIKTFAQTLKMMNLSKKLVETNDIATKRDAYYQSKGAWGPAGFTEQEESDAIMDDVEAMSGFNRERIGFIPDEDGSAVAGELVIIDRDPETNEEIKIDCARMGTGGYSVPANVEQFKFETKAKFILAIETAGMFSRLNYHKFWKKHNCIIISLKGVPSRATRRFIRKLSDDKNLPVYVFTDSDPYGFFNIYRTLKVGSGNAAHINRYFCVPRAKFLGVTPQDILDYKLPTHPLKE
ncbi:DNA topoisomerase VI, partial [Candidatus Woesearchaeota archaeon]|nr:DNA topoisomerase VI [Candidatus Woesearchaeota archaeon]